MLRRTLTKNVLEFSGAEAHIEQNIQGIRQTLVSNFADIERRNEALLFRNLPHRAEGRLRSAVGDVQVSD